MTNIFEQANERLQKFEQEKEQNGMVKSVKAFEENDYQFVNQEIALTQKPYIDGSETPVYKAHGIDNVGNEYELEWEVVDNWEQIEDEQEMVANWEEPNYITKI